MSRYEIDMRQIGDYCWEIPAFKKMTVPVRVYADEKLLRAIRSDNALDQSINVAHMPGIVRASYTMPDAHWGYGFPIGGVAAFDPENGGVISPGGIGYDINCGVRLIRSDLGAEEVKGRIDRLADLLYSQIPCGVGSSGAIRRVSAKELKKVMKEGAGWAVKNGMGSEADLERTEAGGAMEGALPEHVSKKAIRRGRPQLGTLGSGNHFIEVDIVDEVYDEGAARVFGVQEGDVAFQVHCGSRGFGHQICDDYLDVMDSALNKYGIDVPDRQLCCAPLESPEGRRYFGAMAAAANYAWCNRQIVMWQMIEVLEKMFGAGREALGIRMVYDVCHNIAKFEQHDVDGQTRRLCVHRKGATRAFPPGHEEVPPPYRNVGQPVLIPGDMGTASYLLAGTERCMRETWGSTCHGAGRTMSRRGAKDKSRGMNLDQEMNRRGVVVRARGKDTYAEEMPHAYKDINSVVSVVHDAGLAQKVARMKPLAVVKG
ncbi:MAG: RtcB family protein [Candidatus Brocadiia bacterium]